MILSLNSPKGGVGKTTLAILLGTELATKHGYKVVVADADANQHSYAFFNKASVPGFEVVPAVTETNVLQVLRDADARADVVICDLPGATSTLNLKALQRSDFVLIPCGQSLPDARDAFKGLVQIDEASELKGSTIHRAIIWTRVGSGFESRAARAVREDVEAKGEPFFDAKLLELAAFKEMHITGQPPHQAAPTSAAAENVSAITRELIQRILKIKDAA